MSNAIYGGMFGDTLVGYKCRQCGNIFQSMWGETCNNCRTQNKILKELKRANDFKENDK